MFLFRLSPSRSLPSRRVQRRSESRRAVLANAFQAFILMIFDGSRWSFAEKNGTNGFNGVLRQNADDALKKEAVGAQFLSKEQLVTAAYIAELIIPATDTPGALATNTHLFIDLYLANCASAAEKREFVRGISQIDSICLSHYKKTFTELSHTQHTEILQALETGTFGFDERGKQFFRQIKRYTLQGYYTSEVGATIELTYLPIPGGYNGQLPFNKIGKAWSLN